ncbi:hypothetical protein [Ochrobactrum sp. EDr1-4]|uniref:hypothetical protein n=1 Tax=Ochrobactrum sp. EDr1-4 TaxID=3368622 RepID=UPI003BA07D90
MSKFHTTVQERLIDNTQAQKLIMPDLLAREREASQTKWYEYRFMSPLAATKHFAELYKTALKRYVRENQDAELADKVRGMSPDLFTKASASLTEFWNARLHADEMGLPYEILIEFGFHFASRRKWKHSPRPGQLFGSDNSKAIWWEMLEPFAKERIPLCFSNLNDLPQYHQKNYEGTPTQADFRSYIREVFVTQNRPWHHKFAKFCIEQQFLPVAVAIDCVPEDQRKSVVEIVRAECAQGILTAKPAVSLRWISNAPSCFGIPAAINHSSEQCTSCPFASKCTAIVSDITNQMQTRFGCLSPLEDSREQKRKEGQRRRTARHRANKRAASIQGPGA